MTGWTGITYR